MSATTTADDTAQQPAPQDAAIAMPTSLPATMTRSFLVQSIQTDTFVQIFADRIFFGVSQLNGKLGTYLLCEGERNEIDPKQTEYHLTTLLGNREDAMLGVYARTLTERIQAFQAAEGGAGTAIGATTPAPTVLLGISLDKQKGNSPEMFQTIVNLLFDLYLDAMRAPVVE